MDDSNTSFPGPSARPYPTPNPPAPYSSDRPPSASQGVETERLKQQQNLLSGLGRRRDSLSGLSSTSQPIGSMGQNSPAPSYRSTGNYTSGIVADVVREIRDICRVREDATFERLRNLQENHMWSINDTLQRLAKDVDAMQKSVSAARIDLEKLTGRVLQLESIVLPQAAVCLAGAQHNHTLPMSPMPLFGGNVQQALLLQQLQHQQSNSTQQQQQQQQQQYSPQTVAPSQQQFHAYGVTDRSPPNSGGCATGNSTGNGVKSGSSLPSMLRLNYGRTEELYGCDGVAVELGNGNSSGSSTTASVHEASSRVLMLEKGEVELRRDLQDAIAAKNEQSKRIAYLQKVVMALQQKVDSQSTDAPNAGAGSSNNISGIGVIGPVTDL
uniref:Uncharacterized protein n=1 Tax=Anopheles stephensi TaxID=30069 RepID=A0A182YK10_ANOST